MDVILQQFLNFEIMQKVWPLLLRGLGTTLWLCVIVIPPGLVGGLLVALASTSERRLVRWPAIALAPSAATTICVGCWTKNSALIR